MGYTLLKMRIYITEKADNITENGIFIPYNGDIHYSKWRYTLQKMEIYIRESRDIHYSKWRYTLQ